MSHEKTIVSGKKTRMPLKSLKEKRVEKNSKVEDVKSLRKRPRWKK